MIIIIRTVFFTLCVHSVVLFLIKTFFTLSVKKYNDTHTRLAAPCNDAELIGFSSTKPERHNTTINLMKSDGGGGTFAVKRDSLYMYGRYTYTQHSVRREEVKNPIDRLKSL